MKVGGGFPIRPCRVALSDSDDMYCKSCKRDEVYQRALGAALRGDWMQVVARVTGEEIRPVRRRASAHAYGREHGESTVPRPVTETRLGPVPVPPEPEPPAPPLPTPAGARDLLTKALRTQEP